MSKKKKATTKQTRKNSKERNQLHTSNNRPSRQIGPELLGFMAGKFEIVGDIESPIEDWKYWEPAKHLKK